MSPTRKVMGGYWLEAFAPFRVGHAEKEERDGNGGENAVA